MLKLNALVIMGILLAGCAADPYTPSGRMLQLKQGMGKQTAVTIIAKYTKPSPGNGGLCGGSTLAFDAGTPLTVTSDSYSLRAYKSGDLIKTERVGSLVKYTYKKVYYEANRKFAELIKIRVVPGGPVYANCKDASKTNYSLNLYYSTTDFDAIGVAEAGLDEVLAALSTLAPQVKFIQGVGL